MALDDDLMSLGPWPLGEDNRHDDHAIPQGALRATKNVIINSQGHVRRRDGRTLKLSGECHSLWSDGTNWLQVRSGNLEKLTRNTNGTISASTLRSGMNMDAKNFPVSYVSVDGVVYYSNGIVTGKILNGVNRPWGVERPASQPVCVASATGGLDAGRYQVAITFVDDRGEESGSDRGVLVDVVAGGGISVTAIPQPVDSTVSYIRVYVTPANSETFYLWAQLADGTTSYTVRTSSNPGRKLQTQFLIPPPPATKLMVHGGRIYGVDGKFPWYTETLRYGAIKPTNRLGFDTQPTMMVSVDGGLYVAAGKTYFLAGNDPNTFVLREVLPYGAVKGAAIKHPDNQGAFWLSQEGFCYGSPDGSVMNLTQSRIAFDDNVEDGTLTYKETEGIKQVIGTMRVGIDSALQSGDFMGAEILRGALMEIMGSVNDSMVGGLIASGAFSSTMAGTGSFVGDVVNP